MAHWVDAFMLSLASLALATSAAAHTEAVISVTCPLDGKVFTATVDVSGSTFGRRLDLKPIGPIRAPWRIPVCPDNHFVLFKTDFDAGELAHLRKLVESAEYQALAKDNTTYFLLAKTFEYLGEPPKRIAFAYLHASWEAEAQRPEKLSEYLSLALAQLDTHLAASDARPEGWLDSQLLVGELERRLGRFGEARRRFTLLAADRLLALGDAELVRRIVARQLELISQGDSAPHAIPR